VTGVEPVRGRAGEGGVVILALSAEAVMWLDALVLEERPRRRRDGQPWPAVLSEVHAVLADCEAEAKRHAVLPAASVAALLGPASLDRMAIAEAAVLLVRSPRRVQQLVRDRVLSSAGRGFVFRGEVEALVAARVAERGA
jgi:hypothetical protein